MKLFLSHSGDRSRAVAEALHWFIRHLLPATDPWISTGIEKGARWEPEIAQSLEQSGMGIVCVTRENMNARWLLFEAGALSNRLSGKVATFLLDVDRGQIEPPLGQFQHTTTERDQVFALVETINQTVASSSSGK